MAQHAPGQTLQATALMNEAWLRLTGNSDANWRDRQHFFSAVVAMRHILVDRARRRLRLRHGKNADRVDLDDLEIAAPVKEEVLIQLDEALGELTRLTPDRAEIVNLRFFAGPSEAEIASVLGLSERSVQRQWSYTRAWLFVQIEMMKSS